MLRVVLAWEPAYLASYAPLTSRADDGEEERAAQAVLAETLRSVFGADPLERVVAVAIQGVAERVLVEESYAADLLVLGSTPARERALSAVGPVSRGCLRQAHCPVMIVGTCEAAVLAPTLTAAAG